jgi:hypothetical protein
MSEGEPDGDLYYDGDRTDNFDDSADAFAFDQPGDPILQDETDDLQPVPSPAVPDAPPVPLADGKAVLVEMVNKLAAMPEPSNMMELLAKAEFMAEMERFADSLK